MRCYTLISKYLSLLALLALPAAGMAQIETWQFSTCGASGYQGPAQGDCDTAYGATNLAGAVVVNGGKQSWTVPDSGTYRITAVGAAGRSATEGAFSGGRGAQISGEFVLTAGATLQIVVGHMGSASSDLEAPQGESFEEDGGGGGGSFVVDGANSPLLIAGGGGGTRQSADQNGCDANTGEFATTSSGDQSTGGCVVKNADLGLGGIALAFVDYGSAGAGFNGDGEADGFGQGGSSWANGMLGGHVDFNVTPGDGGFGGGGSGEGSNGGGGGGGYSGGDGGWVAGGGGSYNAGANASVTAGVGTGDGSVTIDLIAFAETRATFEVTKDFTDDNPNGVEVTISCNTGLPLEQSKVITEGESVEFVVNDFDNAEMNCEITEDVPAGYSPEYLASGDSDIEDPPVDDPRCGFLNVEGGDENFCSIVNTPGPVDVVIHKEWVFEGSSEPQGIDQRYDLTLWCDAEIIDGFNVGQLQEAPSGNGPPCGLIALPGQDGPQGIGIIADWCKAFFGEGPETFIAEVIPEFPDSHCFVIERVIDSAAEVDNGCRNITVSAGNGAECTITNTVFFEGIPTLDQYGKLLLILLMLGAGFLAYRRIG